MAVTLKPLTADGKPHLTAGGTKTITLDDILIGEVWIGSGQSNMAAALGEDAVARRPPGDPAAARPARNGAQPAADVTAAWATCTPAAAAASRPPSTTSGSGCTRS